MLAKPQSVYVYIQGGEEGGQWSVSSGVWDWVRIDHLFSMGGVWFADFPGDRLLRK